MKTFKQHINENQKEYPEYIVVTWQMADLGKPSSVYKRSEGGKYIEKYSKIEGNEKSKVLFDKGDEEWYKVPDGVGYNRKYDDITSDNTIETFKHMTRDEFEEWWMIENI